jgi:hypothetical protein
VTVTDTGVPQLTSTAEIIVDISNTNDNDPIFNETEYKFSINENSTRGTTIAHVFFAKDANDGNNFQFFKTFPLYFLMDGFSFFFIVLIYENSYLWLTPNCLKVKLI